ncbi:hypothetical protein IQ07DRAFT_135415 [Pyrenochaeta sp. DS3sAY3a]|nr:hypothetical protein IQ07DRAFT_135415 [Pyrenochaeta sp. DS3sAY3a]
MVDPRLDPRANSRGGNYDEHHASTEEMGGRKRRADVFTPLDQHGRPLPLLRFETLGTWRDPLGKGARSGRALRRYAGVPLPLERRSAVEDRWKILILSDRFSDRGEGCWDGGEGPIGDGGMHGLWLRRRRCRARMRCRSEQEGGWGCKEK